MLCTRDLDRMDLVAFGSEVRALNHQCLCAEMPDFIRNRTDVSGTEMNFFFFQAEDGIRDLTVDWSSDVCSSDLDAQGKPARETPIPLFPTSVVRLRNGHLLLASAGTQNVVELDRKGKTVWEFKDMNVRPYRARSEERRVGKESRSRWSPYH